MHEPSLPELIGCTFRDNAKMWVRIRDELRRVFDMTDDHRLVIERPATKFILMWMRELKQFHKTFGGLFGRQKRPPVADDFTASIGICLEQFLAARGFPGRVRSEQTTEKKRGATRPDVSVWSEENRLIASVECKTDFGWCRKKWHTNWEKRVGDLNQLHTDCVSYLCVLCKKGWNADEFAASAKFQKQWFCLSRELIGRLSIPVSDAEIWTPIEFLFLAILGNLKQPPNAKQ